MPRPAVSPGFLDQHPSRAWALVALLTIAAIACAVAAVRAGQTAGPQPPTGARDKGVHAGRNLNIRGRHHTVSGGDHGTLSPQKDPPTEPHGVQPPAGAHNKGVHAGDNLTISGQGHTVVGGDHVAITPQQDQPGQPKRRRWR